ncbi:MULTISPECIES: nuclear transport factor 2 family protein [Actinomycetes]|uniref:nuclear transport factor 2 family protein n=1 Tax=Actinomycetes TaxID=1760 RepID=UPI001E61692F|nr:MULTISPECIES: nuclear transport factor 2 family protein [Actinomycetes]
MPRRRWPCSTASADLATSPIHAGFVFVRRHCNAGIRTQSLHGSPTVLPWPKTTSVRSYFTVLQAVSGLALQPIIAGRYRDRFTRTADGWQFAERVVTIDLVGDVSGHLRGTRPAPVTD